MTIVFLLSFALCFMCEKTLKTKVSETVGAGTSASKVLLQNFSRLLKMRLVSLSLREEYTELGTSEEHRKEPGSLDEELHICQNLKINIYHFK